MVTAPCRSINSEGLPNKGIAYYADPQLISAVTAGGKPYILSLSGLSLDDNLAMMTHAADCEGVAAIELNLACPNIPGKPTMAYDFEQMDTVLAAVCSHPAFGKRPLGVKLAPYFDLPHYRQAADVLNKYPIRFVVCTNTVGNGLLVDVESEEAVIAPKGGFGGLGGAFVKHIALANVRQMRKVLKPEIDIVGVGGVATGADAFALILCGAAAVQVGTRHYKEGASCFDRIAGELEALMRAKGYTSLDDFRGKLKPRTSKSLSAGASTGPEARPDPPATTFSAAFTVGVAALSAAVAYAVASAGGQS